VLPLHCHGKTLPLIDVKPPVASGDRCFFPRPEISEALYAVPVGKWTTPALRKKTPPRLAFFLNDLFTDAAICCGNVRGVAL
jgi:hypothetical protein